jgi:hypothetical protein
MGSGVANAVSPTAEYCGLVYLSCKWDAEGDDSPVGHVLVLVIMNALTGPQHVPAASSDRRHHHHTRHPYPRHPLREAVCMSARAAPMEGGVRYNYNYEHFRLCSYSVFLYASICYGL